jgi:hypothetical protein
MLNIQSKLTFRPRFTSANGGNAWLRNYLYYFTLIGVFSNRFIVHSGFKLRLYYLGLILFCLVVKVTRISAWILCFLAYIALSGIIGLERGTDTLTQVVIEFRAISASVLYYYFFFKLIRFDFEHAFLSYTRLAYWFSVIALPLWAGSCILQHGYVRLAGLALEPADFCSIILPAYYWAAYQFISARKQLMQVVVFTLAVALSLSSIGYISCAFGLFLLLSGRRKHLLLAPVIICALLGFIYTVSSNFRVRFDDTIAAATTGDMTGANLSTYSLISNAIVTGHVLEESPILGNGLGSHLISHDRFLYYVRGLDFFIDMNFVNANAPEAASLTLRVLSEFGILGYLGVLAFVIHFYVGGTSRWAAISNALLTCFFLKLTRNGNYYPPEQFFFVFIYILNYRSFKRETGARAPRIVPRLPKSPLVLSQGSIQHGK